MCGTGIVNAACRYDDTQASRDASSQAFATIESSSTSTGDNEDAAMRKSLQASGVFSDLGRPELLKQWSEEEWEQLRAIRLDKHAAEGDMALLSGCVGTTAVGEDELAALRSMASATSGIPTMSDAPAHIDT